MSFSSLFNLPIAAVRALSQQVFQEHGVHRFFLIKNTLIASCSSKVSREQRNLQNSISMIGSYFLMKQQNMMWIPKKITSASPISLLVSNRLEISFIIICLLYGKNGSPFRMHWVIPYHKR
ncbi:hypothetical protein D3C80_1263230 [compost metagenome]